jgi:uncharacterized protein YndB with AHSA1/START domain
VDDPVFRFITYVGATPAKVWAALVAKDGLWQAWYGAWIESSFKVGERLEFLGPGTDGDKTVHIYGEILVFEPGKTWSFIEHPGPSYKPDHAQLRSRTTYTLEPAGDCTKLTTVVDQWSPNHYGIEKAEAGWSALVSILKTYVETGKILNIG